MIMMDGLANLRSNSAELDFVNAIPSPVITKPGQIVVTAVQVNSVEKLINQYHWLNQSSDVSRKQMISCIPASFLTK